MKRIVLSVAVMLTMGAAAFANNLPEGNAKAEATFKKEFASAELVQWSVEGAYAKASFVLGGNRAIALFNSDGELLGSLRDLVYNQLPLPVISAMEKRFTGSAIFDIRELINNDGTRYKFTLEQKGKKYAASVFPDGSIEEIRKIK
ncbi:MAG TPA: hypothetical protein VFZ42_13430 [Chitinophagaceae bacterium]